MPNELGTASKLWVLDAPTITFDQSLLNVGWSGEITMALPAYLIEHPRGLVLFDTGLNPLAAEDPQGVYGPLADQLGLRFTPDQRVDNQLRALGYRPEDVKYIVASHAQAVQSLRRLKMLMAANDATVWISHDPEDWAQFGPGPSCHE